MRDTHLCDCGVARVLGVVGYCYCPTDPGLVAVLLVGGVRNGSNEPCCSKERRTIEGGCATCGDPCL